jgi:hypothetical protein
MINLVQICMHPVRHSKFRHLVPFGIRKFGIQGFSIQSHYWFGIRPSVPFLVQESGIQSHSWFRNPAFSPIPGSGIRPSVPFGVQDFGIQDSAFRNSAYNVLRHWVGELIILYIRVWCTITSFYRKRHSNLLAEHVTKMLTLFCLQDPLDQTKRRSRVEQKMRQNMISDQVRGSNYHVLI